MIPPIIPREAEPMGLRGSNFAKAHRLFGIALFSWCDNASPLRELSSIPFDKLITAVSRLWNGLSEVSDTMGPVTNEDAQACNGTFFRVPHKLLEGKHGPGRGILAFDEEKNAIRPRYIGAILYNHAGLDIQKDIYIKPYGKEKVVEHELTAFKTGLTLNMKKIILEEVFTASEQPYIDEIADIMRHLDHEQIRAIGTHENEIQTAKAIIFELERWDELVTYSTDLLIDGIKKKDKHGRTAQWYAQEAYEFAEEAFRKSYSNQFVYEKAWNQLDKKLNKEGLLYVVFKNKQQRASVIWNASNVRRLQDDAVKAMEFSKILRAVCYDGAKTKETKGFYKNDSVEGLAKLREIYSGAYQQKLFSTDIFAPIEKYINTGTEFNDAAACLREMRIDVCNFMIWRSVK